MTDGHMLAPTDTLADFGWCTCPNCCIRMPCDVVGVSDDGYAEYCIGCGHWWPLVEDYDMDPAWETCATGDPPKFAEGDRVRDFRDGWVGKVNWFRPGYKIMVTWQNGSRSVWWTHGWNARALRKVTAVERCTQ